MCGCMGGRGIKTLVIRMLDCSLIATCDALNVLISSRTVTSPHPVKTYADFTCQQIYGKVHQPKSPNYKF